MNHAEAMLTIHGFNQEVNKLKQALNGVSQIEPTLHTLSEVFIHLFYQVFMTEQPGRNSSNPTEIISRVNWTYHVAYSMKRAAQIMGLGCMFETMGRQDGVILTPEKNPRIILVAEWEWDYLSVFGDHNELEKLWSNAGSVKDANALLFTYCPESEYHKFVKSVVSYWQEKNKGRPKNYPVLYLVTVTTKFDQKTSTQYMYSIPIVEIHAQGVKVWSYPIFCRAPYKG